jgi:hypothetical protein
MRTPATITIVQDRTCLWKSFKLLILKAKINIYMGIYKRRILLYIGFSEFGPEGRRRRSHCLTTKPEAEMESLSFQSPAGGGKKGVGGVTGRNQSKLAIDG